MINFNDPRIYLKGTCNVIVSDVDTGDILYQTNKTSVGSITTSTNLNEVRAGLGNPIAVMMPSDSGITVDFDAADFSLWAKSAQVGAAFSYAAPVPKCRVVTAASADSLTIDVSDGVPVAKLGKSTPVCYIQEVGTQSFMMIDGTSYPISATGEVTLGEKTLVVGKQYKVWYDVQNTSAQVAKIASLIDPKVVRFEAQMAVFANTSGGDRQGTRVGWLYVTIPYLKMNGEATVSGDQSQNDVTKISGQAIAYDESVVSSVCSDCETSTLAYYVYAPDNAAQDIEGIAVMGGQVDVAKSSTAQIPVVFVMKNGSTVAPTSYKNGFTYTVTTASADVTVSDAGVVQAGTTSGDYEVSVKYAAEDGSEYTCTVDVHVPEA